MLAEPRPEPLIGQEPVRIIVVGTTGSGKTTMARKLAALYGVPHIELDALYWEANWTPAAPEVFRRRVDAATAQPAWVADGGYVSLVGDLVWARAATFVLLEYSFWLVIQRLFRRTVGRIITKETLWNGNRESFRGAFMSRESLFVWAGKTHWRKREKYTKAAATQYPHLRIVRLRNSRAASRWLAAQRKAEQLAPS